MRTILAAVLPLALLAATPGAAAHEGFDEGGWLGETSLHLRIVGAPLLAAGAPLRIEVATDAPGALDGRLEGPGLPSDAWFALREEGALRVADVMLPAAGAWRAHVRDTTGNLASFSFDAWPSGRLYVEPTGDAATRGVVVQGSREPVLAMLVDQAHAAARPPADAVARISGPAGIETVALEARGGALALDHRWATSGVHEVEVLSQEAGLSEGMRPPLQILVVPAEEASIYGLEESRGADGGLPGWAPAAGIAGAVVALAVLAIVLRRVTTGRP